MHALARKFLNLCFSSGSYGCVQDKRAKLEKDRRGSQPGMTRVRNK